MSKLQKQGFADFYKENKTYYQERYSCNKEDILIQENLGNPGMNLPNFRMVS